MMVLRCTVLLGISATALSLLVGCASTPHAPVVERGAPPAKAPVAAPLSKAGDFYTVKKGDTLYSIALDHGHAYRDIAAWNNIDNPNVIKPGQQLRVTPSEGVAVAKPVAGLVPVEVRPLGTNTETYKREPKGGKQPWSEQAVAQAQKVEEPRKEPEQVPAKPEQRTVAPAANGDELEWTWPAGGKVLAGFSEGANKGVDIGGRVGEPVLTAAPGKVVYAGSGLRGYGKLIIIKHNGSYISAYAHNSQILVKEDQTVSKGQKIAELGNSDADQPKLHFEIRHQGKPVDPLKYLPVR